MTYRGNIVLVTPVPPAKTGTANYFEDFLSETETVLEPYGKMIICDKGDYTEMPGIFSGIPVIDCSQYIPSEKDIIILFMANNKYHKYAYALLRRLNGNKVISIVHDLSVCMIVESMLCNGYDGMQAKNLPDYIGMEAGRLETPLIERLEKRQFPDHLRYSLLCQSQLIAKSSALITHSHYAALRLICEHQHKGEDLPVLVMQMPRPDCCTVQEQVRRTENFTIGVFGWVSRGKRPSQIIEAFAQFLEGLPPRRRRTPRLNFVGEIADSAFDPIKIATLFGVQDQVQSTGYVPLQRFRAELLGCDVFLNLRFPSCGETSGTLNELALLGRPFAVSSYQAFKEEKATIHISIDPRNEVSQICSFLSHAYKNWHDGLTPPEPGSDFTNLSEKISPSEAIAKAIEFVASSTRCGYAYKN